MRLSPADYRVRRLEFSEFVLSLPHISHIYRMKHFRKVISLVLLSAMFVLLTGKTVHLFSKEHREHQCCTTHGCTHDCETSTHDHDEEHGEGHRHTHNCSVLDYEASYFLETKATVIDCFITVLSSYYAHYEPSEHYTSLLHSSPRAPPAAF